MNRAIDAFQFFLAGKIYRTGIGTLADGADNGERSVQYQRGIVWAYNELIGRADLDWTVVPPASAHACPAKISTHQQRKRLHRIVTTEGNDLPLGRHIAEEKEEHERNKEQYQIPVVQKLVAHDAAQLVISAELAEKSHRGAACRVLEINAVGQVDGHAETVDHQKESAANPLPDGILLQVQRQEDQHHKKDVGIGNGRGVEIESALGNAPLGIARRQMPVKTMVLQQEGHPHDAIDHIEHENVPRHSQGTVLQ